jgi:hypothetical protein
MKAYGEKTIHKLAKLTIMILQKMSKNNLSLDLCLASILLQSRCTGKLHGTHSAKSMDAYIFKGKKIASKFETKERASSPT